VVQQLADLGGVLAAQPQGIPQQTHGLPGPGQPFQFGDGDRAAKRPTDEDHLLGRPGRRTGQDQQRGQAGATPGAGC